MSSAPPPGEYVLLGLPDVNGQLRGKALSPTAFDSAVSSGTTVTDLLLALDPVDEPITTYETIGIRAGAGDLRLDPDPDTLFELPWREGWSICLADPSRADGSPCEVAVREVARRALAGLEKHGYEAMCAFEYELRLTDPAAADSGPSLSYSLTALGAHERLIAALGPALSGLGIELGAVHTEPGTGLIELNLTPRRGLEAADQAVLAKFCVKDVAASLGLQASFLAKSVPDEEGSSGHVHLSLWRGEDAVFATAPGDGPLAPPFGAAIAGVLDHLPAASLLLNPTINSYKRLVPGWFTPVNASWGEENRSCAVRAIRSAHPERCRFECRRPGADANPYLVLAALAVAASEGLRRELDPPDPIIGDASEHEGLEPLPRSLEAAVGAFERDQPFTALLGAEFSRYYATSRRWELDAWQRAISDWERQRYGQAV